MARPEKLLTARGVMAAKTGRHADGGGLYLEVDGSSRSWIWRYRFKGKRRDMGLGSAENIGLAEARAARDKWRSELKAGRDPIEARARERVTVPAGAPTFGEASDAYIEAHAQSWRNAKHVDQWRMTLLVYAKPIRSKPVNQIATADILAVLKPIWQAKPETASRVRGRIEMVLDAARANEHIDEQRANPARWKGHLDKLLPKRTRLSRGHHAAMPFAQVREFIATLRLTSTVAARALEFTILTAARTGETIGATWPEIDWEGRSWTAPAKRMKAGREHRVPLCARALAILEEMKTVRSSDFIFPGRRPKRPMSNMAFEMMMRRAKLEATAHGFRSSFRDWAGEATSFARELAEAALAHRVGDETELAYRRGDALERRRVLMDAWAAFLEPVGETNVIRLPHPRKAP